MDDPHGGVLQVEKNSLYPLATKTNFWYNTHQSEGKGSQADKDKDKERDKTMNNNNEYETRFGFCIMTGFAVFAAFAVMMIF